MFLSLICILFVFYQPIFGFNVGVGGRSILPLVNGSTSYFVELSDEDATSAGTFVLEFDDGVIPVGNGDASAHWVRHDIRVHVAAIEQGLISNNFFSKKKQKQNKTKPKN